MLDKPAAQHPVSVIDDGGSSIKLIREGYSKRIKPNKNNACQSCVFKTLTCGAAGPVDSPFVIVGESPGKQEMLYGRPFIGQSGDLLKNCLTQLGFYSHGDLPEPYITNAVKCVPDGRKDQNIMQKACHCCRETLMQEIRAYPRKVILALGASAAWALTGDFKLKITQIRGTVYPSPLASEGIVTAVHPAFLLRGGGSLQKFKADVGQAVDLLTKKPRPRYKDSNHIVLETIDDFYRVAKRLDYTVWWHQALDLGPVAIGTDLETSGFSALENYILSAHFGWEDTINYVVPERIFELDGDTGEPLHPAYLEAVRLFYQYTSDRVRFVWHNGKFDIQFLWALNIAARVDEDTMLLSYTLDENPGLHDLEQVSANAIGAPNWKAMLDKYLPNKNSSYAIIPRPVLYKYGGKDIASTIQSFRVLRAQVQADEKLERAYTMVMLSATKLLAKIESNGIYVDRQQNAENKVILTQEIAKIEAEFNAETIQLCNKTFNLNSPADMANVIYGHLQIEPLKGKGYSTGKDILEALPPHKLIKLLLEHRKAKKQLSTYVVNLLPRQDPKVKKRKI
jgi:DNA polymerase